MKTVGLILSLSHTHILSVSLCSRLKRAASVDTASLFSASMGHGAFESDEDAMSYGGDLDDRGDFLASNEPEQDEEEEEEGLYTVVELVCTATILLLLYFNSFVLMCVLVIHTHSIHASYVYATGVCEIGLSLSLSLSLSV